MADPAKIKDVIGAYLPTVTYTTAARFQRAAEDPLNRGANPDDL